MEDDHNDEIQTFIKVWFYVVLLLVYAYFIVSKLIPKGFLRLIFLLPVFYLFTILSFSLKSFHLGAPTAFFLTWLGNFKLLLFSFNLGPLSSSSTSKIDPSKSFIFFITLACFPIMLKENTSKPKIKEKKIWRHQYLISGLKTLLLSFMVKTYDYRQYLNPYTILVISIGQVVLGQDLASPFDEPYLSTSLEECWGRRSSILRSTIYEPVRHISTPIIGKMLAPLPGVFLTFGVSGLMHEVLYYHMACVDPTWEVTWFFCNTRSKLLKNRLQLNPWVSRTLTLGFIAGTGFWLFFPQLIQ
ncbi:hypothetical protein MKX01_009161 [Papaver californicum]|nr:hypothetical protein MKX01_009161 [Papaver californicum]